MPRVFSQAALEALMAESTSQAFILLVTFTHDQQTFRCALNTEPIVSRGFTFEPTYFNFTMPESGAEAPSSCQIIVDNVDPRMIGMIRTIVKPIKVLIELVLGSQPNTVEMTLDDLVMRNVSWNVSQITGTLMIEDMLNAGFPSHMYEPRTFQGIF